MKGIYILIFASVLLQLATGEGNHVGEICGRRDGDKRPETPEEKKKETKAEENKDDKENGKFFYQGDIRMTEKQKKQLEKLREQGLKRDVIHYASSKWTETPIPYYLDSSLGPEALTQIKAGLGDIEGYTCLSFYQVSDPSETTHFIWFKKDAGCWSYVGRLPTVYVDQGYQQTISIGDGCEYKGTVIHEVMHALGFFHEHTRNDRDSFVRILSENIDPAQRSNFDKDAGQISLGIDYDYDSIMHYPTWAFSMNDKPTIELLGPSVGSEVGQRDGLSENDIASINKFYNCPPFSEENAKRRFLKVIKRAAAGQETNAGKEGRGKAKDKAGGKCEKAANRQKKNEAKKKATKEKLRLKIKEDKSKNKS